MALVIPAGFAQAAYRFSLVGDPEVMIVTVGVDTSFGVGSLQELADKLADDFWAGFNSGAAMNSNYTFLGVNLRVGPLPNPAIIEAPRALVGTWVNPPLPSNVAFLVRKTSAIGGRENRGRMYFPPFLGGEGDVSALGMLGDVVWAAQQAVINDAFLGDGFVILHDDAQLGGAPAPTPITGFVLEKLVATQRRRLRR